MQTEFDSAVNQLVNCKYRTILHSHYIDEISSELMQFNVKSISYGMSSIYP